MMERPFVFDSSKSEPILIGLTGSTGSGCTTVARLIKALEANREFDVDVEAIDDGLERRGFDIVYRYFRSECNLSVHILSVVSFITRALLSNKDNYDGLVEFIRKIHVTRKASLAVALESDVLPLFSEFPKNSDDDSWLDRATLKIKNTLKPHEVVFGENGWRESRRQANCYTYIFQELGNALRQTEHASLWPSGNKLATENTLTTIARLVDARIGQLLDNRTRSCTPVVVIDAIRNPFESLYFSKKYSNFYLIAVNRPETERIHALRTNSVKTVEIEDIDSQEHPVAFDSKNCHKVNIGKCEEMADVYLVNSADGRASTSASLRRQVIRHLVLILKPGIVNPTNVEACMQVANTVKLRSGCLSRQVGAVIADKNYRVLSVGWNTAPGNQVPCNMRNAYALAQGEDRSAFSEYENENMDFRNHMKLQLQMHRHKLATNCGGCANDDMSEPFFPYCFKDLYNKVQKNKNQVHTRSIHGEEMAFLDEVADCKDGILFTTSSTCELCAKKAYHKGIARIYYLVPYPGIANEHILKGGDSRVTMTLFRGVTGNAYSRLYTPLISHKDEHYIRSGFSFENTLTGVRIRRSIPKDGTEAQGAEASYLRVSEADGEKKYSIEFVTRDAASTFDIVIDEGYKVAIRYTLKGMLERRQVQSKCPLCEEQNVGKECEYCGFPNAGDSHGNASGDGRRPKVQVYLCADLNRDGEIRANRMHKYVWEKFKLKFVGAEEFCLQSMANDKFLRVDKAHGLIANVDANLDVDDTPPIKECYFRVDLEDTEKGRS